MASPQKEDGYTAIANEIMEALAKIRIAGEARQMLDVIIRKTYGFNKKEDKISTSQFMELTGLTHIAIHKGRRKLLQLNLITLSKKGYSQILTYSFQKDYHKWIPYPKKDTVSKKGTNPIQKRIRSVSQKVTHKRQYTKDNITKDIEASPPSAQTYFYSIYEQKTGHKYIADFGKDGAIFKNLLKIIPEDELKTLIDRFFETTDDFILKAGFTTGVFKTQVNKLRSGAKPLSSGAKILINAKNWIDKTK